MITNIDSAIRIYQLAEVQHCDRRLPRQLCPMLELNDLGFIACKSDTGRFNVLDWWDVFAQTLQASVPLVAWVPPQPCRRPTKASDSADLSPNAGESA